MKYKINAQKDRSLPADQTWNIILSALTWKYL